MESLVRRLHEDISTPTPTQEENGLDTTCLRVQLQRSDLRPHFALFSRARQLQAANSAQPSSLPTTYSLNGFEIFESETAHPRETRDGRHSQNSPRDHRRNPGLPRRRFRHRLPPIMRSCVKIMGSIMPTVPLPHHPLHPKRHCRMV